MILFLLLLFTELLLTCLSDTTPFSTPAGRNKEVITHQLQHGLDGLEAQDVANLIVAYEPVSNIPHIENTPWLCLLILLYLSRYIDLSICLS